ncbi:MAG TPA: hypothetical protein VGA22_03510 [Gemmatimonadales bacterium]
MTSTEPDAATPGPLWLALRVIDEPDKVFEALVARPVVLVPLLILMLISPALMAWGMPDAVLRQQAERQVAAFAERQNLDDEAQARMIADSTTPTRRAIIFASGAIGTIIFIAVTAGLLQLIFNATGRERLRFKQEFALVTHAWMPMFWGGVLMLMLWRVGGMTDIALSLGFLFDREDSPFLASFAGQLTLFGAWSMVLVAMGNQIFTRAKSLTGPLMIVGGLWLAAKVAFAAIGAVVGGLGG